MIVKMMKVSLVVAASRQVDALSQLKKVGVLHPEVERVASDDLIELQDRLEKVRNALILLPKGDEIPSRPNGTGKRALEVAEAVLDLQSRIRELSEERDELKRERERLLPWGDFDPADITMLRTRGIDIRLYEATNDQFARAGEGRNVFVINKTKSAVKFAVVLSEGETPPELNELPLPRYGLSRLESLIAEKNTGIEKLRDELATSAVHREMLVREEKRLADALEFEEVRASMGSEERLNYLTGYVPMNEVDKLEKAAEEHGWALLVRDPDPGDQVPTLVKNPRWIRIIRPVFDLLGTVPGYREYDISFFFLLFFSVFFAMIIGDAGYGSILLLGTIGAAVSQTRGGKRLAPGIILLFVLSITTVVWGAATGTWFGSQSLANLPAFSWMIVPQVYSFNENSGEMIKLLCFVLGAIQISIAHIWNFLDQIRRSPRIRAFAQLAWLSLVLGVFYLVLNLVLDPTAFPVPDFAIWMIAGGFVGVLLFGNQEGNFFRGIAAGFGNILPTFLSGIGAFSDIVSYIRLFAVGLASVEVAKSFNAMAAGFGSGWIGIIGGAVILLLGHALNLAMGALAVIVHGVRLNMLEFSGHLGMEWSGQAYKPFAEKE